MLHVLVETNWVVGYAAPAHHRLQAACDLLDRAARGELRLHLPAICISEAKRVLGYSRYQPREEAKAVREFVRWARQAGSVSIEDAAAAHRVVDCMEQKLRADRLELPKVLDELNRLPGLDVFPLSELMLKRSLAIAADLELEPFDQAILAAVLVRGTELRDEAASEVCFATMDAHLQCWDKQRGAKQPLTEWYDAAGVWVCGDFTLTWPPRPSA